MMKLVKSLENKCDEEWLRYLDLFNLENRKLRGDLISVFNYQKGCSMECFGLFSEVASDRTSGNGLKCHQVQIGY
ncbi:hypothetical protein AV530_017553 [Patagioenas fasciata monilis]|uniref:Uncharacterized protein n=1 Tax=Patagioenas fasciata monilis TaxID=372326 RepID=A0A1V4J3I0_PATFA|nr:hypothetical protein AV530_017553 [Patagioenas fasciata monilis]